MKKIAVLFISMVLLITTSTAFAVKSERVNTVEDLSKMILANGTLDLFSGILGYKIGDKFTESEDFILVREDKIRCYYPEFEEINKFKNTIPPTQHLLEQVAKRDNRFSLDISGYLNFGNVSKYIKEYRISDGKVFVLSLYVKDGVIITYSMIMTPQINEERYAGLDDLVEKNEVLKLISKSRGELFYMDKKTGNLIPHSGTYGPLTVVPRYLLNLCDSLIQQVATEEKRKADESEAARLAKIPPIKEKYKDAVGMGEYKLGMTLEEAQIVDSIQIRESKTKKTNTLVINKEVHKALRHFLNTQNPNDDEYLFKSRQRNQALTVMIVNRMIKSWCKSINLPGNYGAHTLRKTFGYIQRTKFGVGFEVLCRRFNHSSPAITMRYLGITDQEVYSILQNEI